MIFLNRRMKENEKNRSLSVIRDSTEMTGVMSTLRRWDANILCCAETQTAWDIFSVRYKVESEIRKCYQYAGMIGSSSESATCNPFKPGGTMTVFDRNWPSRITKGVDSHKLGRWSYVTIQGRNYTCLIIITSYRCCSGQTSKNVGMNTSLMQQ